HPRRRRGCDDPRRRRHHLGQRMHRDRSHRLPPLRHLARCRALDLDRLHGAPCRPRRGGRRLAAPHLLRLRESARSCRLRWTGSRETARRMRVFASINAKNGRPASPGPGTEKRMRRPWPLAAALALGLALAGPGVAQNAYAPAYTVNDSVITHYDIEQRTRLLEALGATGDVRELAVEQLKEDRVKVQAGREAGIELS